MGRCHPLRLRQKLSRLIRCKQLHNTPAPWTETPAVVHDGKKSATSMNGKGVVIP
jgi:hypothetical protein